MFYAQNQISHLSKYNINCIKTFNMLVFFYLLVLCVLCKGSLLSTLDFFLSPLQCASRSYAPLSENRGLYAGATVLSSPSTEELSQDQGDRASLDAADSGRGSWTSCSSGSHDNIQTIQHQRSWETLPFGHAHFDNSGDGAGLWASGSHVDQLMFSDHGTKYSRQSQGREGLDQAQSRGSWASSTGYWGEDSEGDTGTIKRRGGKDVSVEAETSCITSIPAEEAKPAPMPAHIPVTSSTTKGHIGKLNFILIHLPTVPSIVQNLFFFCLA